jgi:hypothetical protein
VIGEHVTRIDVENALERVPGFLAASAAPMNQCQQHTLINPRIPQKEAAF